MKNLIIVLFVFISVNSYGQENEFHKKHHLLWDFGVNHTSNLKPEYHPAYERYNIYPKPETLYPGYTIYPAFNFITGLKYRYYYFRGFNANIGIDILYMKSKLTRNSDSLKKYFLYPDSIKENFEILYPGAPRYSDPSIISKLNSINVYLNLSIGYRYKRIFASIGIILPLYEYSRYYNEYENGQTRKGIYKTEFNHYSSYWRGLYFNTRLEFLIYKKKFPISVYMDANDKFYFGITLNKTRLI